MFTLLIAALFAIFSAFGVTWWMTGIMFLLMGFGVGGNL
jgi:hypothetical protein